MAATGLFLLPATDGGPLVEMREQPYEREAVLQELLAQYPSLMAGDQISPAEPRRWLLVQRELGVAVDNPEVVRWWVDHLFIDQDAIPTIVEVKRSADARIRREVVGQMLDYAAHAAIRWDAVRFEDAYRARCAKQAADADDELAAFVIESELSEGEVWQRAESNLRAGKVRLVFVADVISPELQRVIEYLNEQMRQTDVLGVEVKQYAGTAADGRVVRTIVPRVVGQSGEKIVRENERAARVWTKDTVLATLAERQGASARTTLEQVIAWADQRALRFAYGKGKVDGSLSIVKDAPNGHSYWPFVFYTNGGVEIVFEYLAIRPPFDDLKLRAELARQVSAATGVTIADARLSLRPGFPIGHLADPERLAALLDVWSWFLDQVPE